MMFFVIWACSTGMNQDTQPPLVEVDPPTVIEEDIATGGWSDEVSTQGRVLKRMRVSHVRDAMEAITGVTWGGGTSKWDTYADSLGVPDYQQRMTEDRSPSVIFQKFLSDAATESCMAWIDPAGSMFVQDPYDRSLPVLRENIASLRWYIQGHPKESTSPIIEDYLALNESVFVRVDDAIEAWQTVCVAMFTHPDFWMY